MKNNRVLLIFLVKVVVMYVIWEVFSGLYLKPDGAINDGLTWNIAQVSAWLMSLFGMEATAHAFPGAINMIYVNAQPIVRIEAGCNGLVLMALFAGFIIAYPGPVNRKLWYIPAGLLAVYVINIIRVIVLTINNMYSKSTFDFNHKYTYAITTYACIFALWMLWANRLSGEKLLESDTTAAANSL